MKVKARTEAEDDDLPFAEPEPPVEPPYAGGYRVAANLHVRASELDQELAETRARYKALERELWATRKSARKNRAVAVVAAAASKGGIGATLASLCGIALFFADIATSPPILLGLVVVGYLLGALLNFGAKNEDDDDFPPAPPARMF